MKEAIMRAVFGLVLVLGMGLAGFAVYMVNGHLSSQQQLIAQTRAQAAKIVPTVEIYAVNRPIAYGEVLTVDDIEKIHYAEAHLPEGTFATEEELFPEGPEITRIVTRPMEINEPILAVKVTEPGEVNGITALLAPGTRAFTINVDGSTGVSGFLRPGDKVDVYWTGSVDGAGTNDGRNSRNGREITRLIKSSIELIAVDQTSDVNQSGASIARTVTVQVSPHDVASLAQAQSTGKLSLSLVGSNETEVATAFEIDQAALLGIEEVAAPVERPQEVQRVCTIRKRSGTEVVDTPIPCSDQ